MTEQSPPDALPSLAMTHGSSSTAPGAGLPRARAGALVVRVGPPHGRRASGDMGHRVGDLVAFRIVEHVQLGAEKVVNSMSRCEIRRQLAGGRDRCRGRYRPG